VDGAGQQHILGTVVKIYKVPTSRAANADQSIDMMGQMYGILGVLVAEVLSIEKLGYTLYSVKAGDGPAFEAASRAHFTEGDCVDVSFPESMGDRPHVGIDADVEITKSSGCAPASLLLQLTENDFLEVTTPNGTSWQLLEKKTGSIVYGRKGEASNETLVAYVQAFILPPTKDNNELLSFVRSGVEKDSPSDRFTSIEAGFEIIESRGYPCVRFKGINEDKQAKTGFFSKGTLTLQSHALYCRHPQQPTLGFVIAYTHRGEDIYGNLELEAEEFIQRVRIPTNK